MKKLWAVALVVVLLFAISMVAYQRATISPSSPRNLLAGQRISVGFATVAFYTVVRQDGPWVLVDVPRTSGEQRWINLNQAQWVTIQ